MASKRTVFIINPKAGNGSAGREWPRIQAMARDRLGPFQFHITSGPGDATQLARNALLEGAERVVCVGGNGTLNEVVNGFMGENGPIQPEAVLGFIPDGTGCDFVRTVSIPSALDKALDTIADSHVRSINIGRLSYRDHQGNHTDRQKGGGIFG